MMVKHKNEEIIILPQRNLNKIRKFEKIFGCGLLLGSFSLIGTDVIVGEAKNQFAVFYAVASIVLAYGGFILLSITVLFHFILLGLGFSNQKFILRKQECLLSDGFWGQKQGIQYYQFSSVYLYVRNKIKFLANNGREVGEFFLSGFSANEIETILLEFRKRSKKIQIASVLRKEYAIKPDIEIEKVKPAKSSIPQPENPSPRRKRKIISANDMPAKPQNSDDNISRLKPKRRLEL